MKWRSVTQLGFALGLALWLLGCPKNPLDKARQLEKAGEKEAAAQAYTAAAKADHANLGAWDGALHIWCHDLARIDRCLEVLDLELATLGNLTRHQDYLSEALEKRGRQRIDQGIIKSGLMDLKRAEKAGPRRASVFVAQATAYNAIGIRHLAVKALERARQLDPHNQEANEIAKQVPEEEGFGGARKIQTPTKEPKN